MGSFAESYSGNSLEEFNNAVSDAMRILLASRPTAVSLWNGVHASVRGLSDAGSVGEARELIISNSKAFVESSEKAVETIARIGAKRICDGDTVMTHCNSSAAVGVLKEAHRQGKDF